MNPPVPLPSPLLSWLLEGDVSLRYQVHRDLLGEERSDLQERIPREGWGKRFLDEQGADGHWGAGFYRPKWTSTHYTLLDLRNLCVPENHPSIGKILLSILSENVERDGGINPAGTVRQSDVCINGMLLNYACYFAAPEEKLRTVVDFILGQRMPDGGFNCRRNRSGARHSSLHSTLSVAEGIREYVARGYRYRREELKEAEDSCVDFMLIHSLFLSDRTGEVIHPGFLRLAYPCRWRYDILRALDYFRSRGSERDARLEPALERLVQKRKKDGTWNAVRHAGATHFDMEPGGRPSRWNTLRGLRTLVHFRQKGIQPDEATLP